MNWREMTEQINDFDEDQLYDLIEAELKGQRRKSILIRLHQRFCAVRDARERQEILGELNAKD